MSQVKPTRYHRLAITIHWVSALLILPIFIFGKIMVDLPLGAQRSQMLQTHVAIGLIVTVLTIVRIISLLRGHHPAALPMPTWEKLAFEWNHRVIYVLLFAIGLSGISTLLASGMLPLPGTLDPALIADVLPREGHELTSTLLLLLFVMHVGGVAYYQFRHGRTLARMGIGRG